MVENLRPRGVGEILDAAVSLYRARFGALVRLTAIVVIPVQVFNALVLLSTAPEDVTIGTTGPTPVYDSNEAFWVPLAGTLVVNIAVTLSTAFAIAAVMRLVADEYVGSTPGASSARLALQRLGPVLGLATITSLVVLVGTFACLLPGLFLQVVWIVAMPALLLEGAGVGGALKRSFQLTKTRFWSSAAVYFVGSMLTGLVSFGLTLVAFAAIGAAVEGTTALAISQGLAGALTSVLTTPFTAAAVIVLYFDLRVRTEGYDVQVELQRLDAARAAVS
jgi:hypothetical protein